MDFDALDRLLRETAADQRLDEGERLQLRELGAQLDADRARFLRNRAFELVRERVLVQPAQAAELLRWLQQVIRTLDAARPATAPASSVFFSPGEDCLRCLLGLCRQVRRQLDICVFTVADDRLSAALLDCHRRGVRLRLITDDDKAVDAGSDVDRLREAGIAVRLDRSRFHMHHKFALFDDRVLVNGSFNWTRTASTSNQENLVVSEEAGLLQRFAARFEQLWAQFAEPSAP